MGNEPSTPAPVEPAPRIPVVPPSPGVPTIPAPVPIIPAPVPPRSPTRAPTQTPTPAPSASPSTSHEPTAAPLPVFSAQQQPDCDNPDNVFCSQDFGKCYCHDPNFGSERQQAQRACRSAGYNMVSIISQAENSFIFQNIEQTEIGRLPDGTLPTGGVGPFTRAWIGLEDGQATVESLRWPSLQGVVYTPPDFQVGGECFSMERVFDDSLAGSSQGRWVAGSCGSPSDIESFASVVCEQPVAQNNLLQTPALQRSLFSAVPNRLVSILSHLDGSFVSSSFDFFDQDLAPTLLAIKTQNPFSRFRLAPDASGVGFTIQTASGTTSEGKPIFSEGEASFLGVGYGDVFKDDSFVEKRLVPMPALVTRESAAVFLVESSGIESGAQTPPFGLKLKFEPSFHLTVNPDGSVTYSGSTDVHTLAIQGAPETYQMVVSIDDFDFENNLLQDGVVESTIAAKRTVTSPSDGGGKYVVELTAQEEESRSVTSGTGAMRERFISKAREQERSTTIGGEASVEFLGIGSSVSGSSTDSLSFGSESSAGWTSSVSVENSFSERRAITFVDRLELDLAPDTTIRARLVVTRRTAERVEATATGRLYADGVLVSVARFPVTLNAVAMSSGRIVVDEILDSQRGLRGGSNSEENVATKPLVNREATRA